LWRRVSSIPYLDLVCADDLQIEMAGLPILDWIRL